MNVFSCVDEKTETERLRDGAVGDDDIIVDASEKPSNKADSHEDLNAVSFQPTFIHVQLSTCNCIIITIVLRLFQPVNANKNGDSIILDLRDDRGPKLSR